MNSPMDLERRDYFAVKTMERLLALGGSFLENGSILYDNIAKSCYNMAEAMERARIKPRVAPSPPGSRKSLKPKASKDIFDKILELHREGFSNKQIADKFGINGQSVNGVVACSKRLIPPKK